MKIELGSSSDIKNPKPKVGWSVWIEHGVWFTAKKVNKKRFGPHSYFLDFLAGKSNLCECSCGCFMADSSSGGDFDPWGACPKNPKAPTLPVQKAKR